MIKRAFTEHPASVGETYWQHLGCALSFGASMIIGGVACLLHGLLPFAFTKSGSRRIEILHRRMVTHRDRRIAHPQMPPLTDEGGAKTPAIPAAE